MKTNSFKKGFILTSNRDETPERIAIPPEIYDVNGVKMMFPKDSLSGGTWIGIGENCRVICLLNGAFEAHERKAEYRKSRGVVVKELLSAIDIQSALKEYFLKDIEPFTIVLVDWIQNLNFVEFVWDGKNRYIKELPLETHIWSSSPLYNEEMRKKRNTWFRNFLKGSLSSEKILKFHHSGGEGNKELDLVMDRGFIRTQSITQVENYPDYSKMNYEDLSTGEVKVTKIRSISSFN